MSIITSLVREAVIDGFLLASAKRKAENLKLAAIFYLFAIMLAMPMIGFLALAGYFAVAQILEPIQAALAIAGILFVLMIVFMITAKRVLKRRGREVAATQEKLGAVASSFTTLFSRNFNMPIRRNPKKSLLAASVLGLLAARRFR